MQHNIKYTTCDRCGKKLKQNFPQNRWYGACVGIESIKCQADRKSIDYALLCREKELEEEFPIIVSYEGFVKKEQYDLCPSCANELKAFFTALNKREVTPYA